MVTIKRVKLFSGFFYENMAIISYFLSPVVVSKEKHIPLLPRIHNLQEVRSNFYFAQTFNNF